MKVFLEGSSGVGVATVLDRDMLACHVELVSNPKRADVLIYCTVYPAEGLRHKTIMTYMEPPIARGFLEAYTHPEQFKHVYTFNPRGPHQSPITRDPIAFPYGARTELDRGPHLDGPSDQRTAFYAGSKEPGANGSWKREPDRAGRVNLYQARNWLVEDLRKLGARVVLHPPSSSRYRSRR